MKQFIIGTIAGILIFSAGAAIHKENVRAMEYCVDVAYAGHAHAKDICESKL